MNDNPVRVSVVLPFLNAERFLSESVESVLAQTYSQWELLLVDDGSADASSAMAREYAALHPDRIRYIEHSHHENMGISASRNVGVSHARGEFIAELDADDVWLAGKLEHYMPVFEAHPEVGMLYANSLYWYSWSGDATDASRDYLPDIGVPVDTVVDPVELLLRQLEGKAPAPCPSAVVLRKSVVQRVGGSEDAFRGTHEDLVLYAKMMLAAPVLVVGGWWDRYRCYSGASTSVTVSEQQTGVLADTRRRYLEWLADYLSANGLRDSPHRHLTLETLRRQRFPRTYSVLNAARHSARHVAALAGRALGVPHAPAMGYVRMGDLRSVTPINRHWGWERGGPVDRHYIEGFLALHAADIHGRVLEVADNSYTRRFGGDNVLISDVLDISADNRKATIVADLADAHCVGDATFNCVILTQTLQYVYDVPAAMRTLYRILAPGGTLLMTVPGITPVSDETDDLRNSRYWCFTVPSVTRLAADVFPGDCIEVESHGNVLAAISFLHGIGRPELRAEELEVTDRDFPLVITLRAYKPPGRGPS